MNVGAIPFFDVRSMTPEQANWQLMMAEGRDGVELEEEWAPIRGFDGYFISTKGRVGSTKTDTILKPRPSGWGYLQVMFWQDGRSHTKSIHLLVAQAFVPGEDHGLEPNHIDGDKLNNRDDNLEWVTKRENNQHAVNTGLRKLYSRAIRIVETGEVFPSVKACAEHLGTYPTAISAVLTGRRPHYKRLTFSYEES